MLHYMSTILPLPFVPSWALAIDSLARPLRLRECAERESTCRRSREGINSKGPRRDQWQEQYNSYVTPHVYIDIYPIPYIQYGNLPIRHSPPPRPTPPQPMLGSSRGAGGGWGGGRGGGIPYGYISIMERTYWISIYVQRTMRISSHSPNSAMLGFSDTFCQSGVKPRYTSFSEFERSL